MRRLARQFPASQFRQVEPTRRPFRRRSLRGRPSRRSHRRRATRTESRRGARRASGTPADPACRGRGRRPPRWHRREARSPASGSSATGPAPPFVRSPRPRPAARRSQRRSDTPSNSLTPCAERNAPYSDAMRSTRSDWREIALGQDVPPGRAAQLVDRRRRALEEDPPFVVARREVVRRSEGVQGETEARERPRHDVRRRQRVVGERAVEIEQDVRERPLLSHRLIGPAPSLILFP